MLLGCIGDDFTGSSDLANTLAREGMRVVQYTGVPTDPAAADVEAGVVALKSRSVEPAEAVRQSLVALAWLKAQGCTQFFFKYCSTFDSTPRGNIGPVAEALANELDAGPVIVCPAFPGTGRSVYQGHLFVHDRLLNESGLENHPINPMTDADLRRWLAPQTNLDVGHINATVVLQGAAAIRKALDCEAAAGKTLVVVDALQDRDLREIGGAAADLALVTGGSGVAMGLPDNFRRAGLIDTTAKPWSGQAGKCVALSGSCSKATRRQVAQHGAAHPAFEVLAADVIAGELLPAQVSDWCIKTEGVPLVYSSAAPETVARVQAEFGMGPSAAAVEQFFAEVARQLVDAGVERLLVAGGETSGAVIEGLTLEQFEIGPEIDPGVPALRASSDLVVALKSGNFGAADFFAKAADILGQLP